MNPQKTLNNNVDFTSFIESSKTENNVDLTSFIESSKTENNFCFSGDSLYWDHPLYKEYVDYPRLGPGYHFNSNKIDQFKDKEIIMCFRKHCSF